jgi:RNA polymerase sigma-70 factor, ECF subfamily
VVRERQEAAAMSVSDPSPTDAELLATHLADPGDPRAFDQLLRRHRLGLWTLAVAILREPDDASDAVQTALLRAFRLAHTYRGESDVLAWLRAIVRNTSLRARQRRARPGHGLVSPAEADPARPDRVTSGAFDEVDSRDLLRRAIGDLSPEFARAFYLVRHVGFSYAETATLEQVSIGTVRSRVSRARAILARRHGELSDPEGR